ncbi:MAG: protoheme IX farnesyltransferase [Rickettsia sp.]|nr:protoheme IX farnesyltransferase [Rickettsia sp.]
MKNFFHILKSYLALTKPKIIVLVLFTSLTGMSLADMFWDLKNTLIAFFAIALGSGGSACINMWYDKDIDKLMLRTKNRPLVKAVIKPLNALLFGIFLSCLSIILMYMFINVLSSFLMIIAIIYYAVIYTMILKRYSVYNVVFGGVPGAMPPVIGFSAVSGKIGLESIILFFIIFFWSPFHSWALIIFRLKDYAKSNLPILPLVSGLKRTITEILLYVFLTIIVSYLPYFFNFADHIYLFLITILNIWLIYYSYKLRLEEKNHIQNAKTLFLFSTIYLFFLFFIIFLQNVFVFYKVYT